MSRGGRVDPEKRAEVVRLAATTHLSGIARETGLGIGTVDAILRKADIRPAVKAAPGFPAGAGRKPEPWKLPPEPPQPRPSSKPVPLDVARFTFGRRLRVDEAVGGFFLDDRPVRFSELMRRVNAQHAAWGQPQPLTAVPEWVMAEKA